MNHHLAVRLHAQSRATPRPETVGVGFTLACLVCVLLLFSFAFGWWQPTVDYLMAPTAVDVQGAGVPDRAPAPVFHGRSK